MRTRTKLRVELTGRALAGAVGLALGTGLLLALPVLAAQGGAGQVCLDCHEDQASSLEFGPHRLSAAGEGRLNCLSCHDGDPRHWEDDPASYPMANPADMGSDESGKLCGRCHDSVHQSNQRTVSPHASAGVSCLDCHQVHASEWRGSLVSAQPGLCFGCHPGQRADFSQPFHHPADEGIMDCSDCHLKSDEGWDSLVMRGGDAVCLGCHAEFQGPFPFEHQAGVGYSTEEGSCLNCHDPHGSAYPRLLKQPYEGPHFQLCSQCHSVPGHRDNSQHGAEWADMDCGECHVDIHGSYTSSKFFAPIIEAQGCNALGCHQR